MRGETSRVRVGQRAKNRSAHRDLLDVGQTAPSAAEQDVEVLNQPAELPAALVNKVVFERRVIEPPQSEIETWH